MIYEIRVYDAAPGKMKALVDRFVNTTLGTFEKHGIRPLLFLEPVIGTSNQLIYLLEWENMAERENKWDAFQRDPDWIAARAASEREGSLTAKVTNSLVREVPSIMSIVRGKS